MPTGNPYVDTKIASEQVVLAAHAAREMIAPSFAPPIFTDLAHARGHCAGADDQKRIVPFAAHGQGMFRAIYIDDLVNGVMLAAEKDEASGQIFILGGEKTIRCEKFFGHYYRMLGKGRPRKLSTPVAVAIAEAGRAIIHIARQTNGTGPRRDGNAIEEEYSVECQSAARVGWEPQMDLDEGMRRTEFGCAARNVG